MAYEKRANYGARGFAVSGPRLWNSLPMSVRELYDKPEQFKKVFLKATQNISDAAVASASVDSYQKSMALWLGVVRFHIPKLS